METLAAWMAFLLLTSPASVLAAAGPAVDPQVTAAPALGEGPVG